MGHLCAPRPLPPTSTPTDRQMDARDVDWACVAVDDEDEGDGIVLYHRSVEDPRSIVRRVVARGGGSTSSTSSSTSSVVCRVRGKCATCLDVRRRTRAVVVGDADGYVRWCDGDGDEDDEGAMTCRLDVTSVTRIDANGGYASTSSRVFETDAKTTTATRRWSLPRLEPMVAAFGRRAPSGEGDVTLIAVGGAAVASCSAGRASGGGRDAARSVFSAFRALGSTALGVVKTAFVDASAPLDEDAVVYEGEDLDAVSSLRLEKATWNAAFVDAPRRFLRVASSPPPFDFFAVSDVAHRVLLFRLIGTKALRLTAVIKGCRDASFCFHPRSGLLALHRPSVRRLETRDPRDGAVVDAVDATDVIRLIRGFTSIVVVVKTHSGDDHRVEMRPVEDSFPSSRPVPSRPASLIV